MGDPTEQYDRRPTMAGLHATSEGEEEAPDVMAQPLPPASACGCDLLLQLPLHGRRRRRRQRQWRHPVPPLGLHSSPLLLLVVALALLARPTLAVDFTFTWPTPSYQCYPLTMTWQGGTPPYQAVIAPALQLPFVYKIPASACAAASGQCAYTVSPPPPLVGSRRSWLGEPAVLAADCIESPLSRC